MAKNTVHEVRQGIVCINQRAKNKKLDRDIPAEDEQSFEELTGWLTDWFVALGSGEAIADGETEDPKEARYLDAAASALIEARGSRRAAGGVPQPAGAAVNEDQQ